MIKLENKIHWTEDSTKNLEFLYNKDEVIAKAIYDNESSIILKYDKKFEMKRFTKTNDGFTVEDEETHKFDNISECLKYLRSIRNDHAINYDYKELTKKLISELYLNNHITPSDIIS